MNIKHIRIAVNNDDAKSFKDLCSRIGVSASEKIRELMKRAVAEHKIPVKKSLSA